MQPNLLKLLRQGKSQAELGAKFGVSQQGWQSWECGRTTPDPQIMLRMEKEFDLPMEIIFFGNFNNKTK